MAMDVLPVALRIALISFFEICVDHCDSQYLSSEGH